MSTKGYWKFITAILVVALIAGVGLVPYASATAYHTVNPADCSVADFAGDELMPAGGGTESLYVTWDATYLYVAVAPATYAITVYLDTQVGGTATAVYASHAIAAAGGGYEYAYWIDDGNYMDLSEGASGSWGAYYTPSGVPFCGNSSVVEIGIPWADIGNPTHLTMLVTDRTEPSVMADWWPATARNENTTPSFSDGIIFDNLGDGVSPNSSPTAITLNNLTARNSTSGLTLLAGVLVLSSAAVLFLRRRNRQTEI